MRKGTNQAFACLRPVDNFGAGVGGGWSSVRAVALYFMILIHHPDVTYPTQSGVWVSDVVVEEDFHLAFWPSCPHEPLDCAFGFGVQG